MPELKPIKRKEFYLKKLSFEGPFSGGKHQYMIKEDIVLVFHDPETRKYTDFAVA